LVAASTRNAALHIALRKAQTKSKTETELRKKLQTALKTAETNNSVESKRRDRPDKGVTQEAKGETPEGVSG